MNQLSIYLRATWRDLGLKVFGIALSLLTMSCSHATAMLAVLPGCRIVEIPVATHCDFEARPSALCHRLTGSSPDAARTAEVHKTLLRESSLFLKTQ